MISTKVFAMKLVLCLMAASLAIGCAHSENRNESPVADEPRPARPDREPTEPPAPETEPAPFNDLTDEELEQALDRAIAAALAAEGETSCERSYNAMVAMRDSLVADLGDAAAQDLPLKSRFMEACEMLPEDAQRCMDVAYAMENQEDCQRIMDSVPAEQRRPLEEVLQGG